MILELKTPLWYFSNPLTFFFKPLLATYFMEVQSLGRETGCSCSKEEPLFPPRLLPFKTNVKLVKDQSCEFSFAQKLIEVKTRSKTKFQIFIKVKTLLGAEFKSLSPVAMKIKQ